MSSAKAFRKSVSNDTCKHGEVVGGHPHHLDMPPSLQLTVKQNHAVDNVFASDTVTATTCIERGKVFESEKACVQTI